MREYAPITRLAIYCTSSEEGPRNSEARGEQVPGLNGKGLWKDVWRRADGNDSACAVELLGVKALLVEPRAGLIVSLLSLAGDDKETSQGLGPRRLPFTHTLSAAICCTIAAGMGPLCELLPPPPSCLTLALLLVGETMQSSRCLISLTS